MSSNLRVVVQEWVRSRSRKACAFAYCWFEVEVEKLVHLLCWFEVEVEKLVHLLIVAYCLVMCYAFNVCCAGDF